MPSTPYLARMLGHVVLELMWVLRSRKTLIYLILTLNHCYPDYDFSLLRAHHFRKEPGVASVEEAVDSHLLEVSKVLGQSLLHVEITRVLSAALRQHLRRSCAPDITYTFQTGWFAPSRIRHGIRRRELSIGSIAAAAGYL